MRGVRTNRHTIEDPYQLNDLSVDDLDRETLGFLIGELAYWLKKADDEWYRNRLCEDLIQYG